MLVSRLRGLLPGALLAAGALGAGGLASTDGLEGQSIVRGEVEGTVQGEDLRTLQEASVMATDGRTGASVWVDSERDGSFRIPLLRAGDYEILVEAMGYVPRLYRGVRVPSGRTVRLAVTLAPAPPPVDFVDTV
jgi:hypothetical protein